MTSYSTSTATDTTITTQLDRAEPQSASTMKLHALHISLCTSRGILLVPCDYSWRLPKTNLSNVPLQIPRFQYTKWNIVSITDHGFITHGFGDKLISTALISWRDSYAWLHNIYTKFQCRVQHTEGIPGFWGMPQWKFSLCVFIIMYMRMFFFFCLHCISGI